MGIKLVIDGTTHDVTIVRRRPHLVLRIDGEEHEVTEVPDLGDGRRTMTLGGHEFGFIRVALEGRHIIRVGGRTYTVDFADPFSRSETAGGGQNAVRAPMPGAVVAVHRRAGEPVTRGEPLITIESMKLQTALPAPRDGVVATIHRTEGETFEKDEILAMVEPMGEKA